MATASFHHGVRVTELNAGTTALRIVSTAVIGMVATASDADAEFFPVDTPVLVTDIRRALEKAGTLGTLAPSLEAIEQQCRPAMVIVRVADGEGATEEERQADQISKAVGDYRNGKRTGAQALLDAQATLGVKPRILGAPGLDAKPVADALTAIGEKLRGMVYASAWECEDVSAALLYQNDFGKRETMLIWPEFTRWSTVQNKSIVAPATAYALGLRARIDAEQGWHKSLSNVPLNGPTGISRSVYWDLQGTDSDADLLNEGKVTTLINHQGFRFWGNRTCSTEQNFAFETATRTAHILADTMVEGHFEFVDKPLHPSIVKDIIEGINSRFRTLRSQGYILGGECWYDETVNSTETLKTGKLLIDYDYTPVPPLEDLGFRQRITDRFYLDFANRVSSGL
ncbi:phage tail sheath protein [Delftia tsuruhatensis]|uniref:phage tail sheath protein n=1 Tax=Delftia TaxID=80865 RepID=UPI0010550F4D|nr:phage tail sheath protein [Delftia tsuruhatensis]MDH1827017.1 phage tail sheath protein [Delftia tsuruhatensis]TDF27236.1 phage tail sheath protein [Delftia tsuruhatensis]